MKQLLLDFDDAGASNEEPAKGVTVGDIRSWYDEMQRLRTSGFKSGYAQAILDADYALRKRGDDFPTRCCRRDVLALAHVQYDPSHVMPQPDWSKHFVAGPAPYTPPGTEAHTSPTPMDETTIARAIWDNMRCLVDDYSDVDFDMIMRRPRYSGLRGVIFVAAQRVIEACAPSLTSPESTP